MTASRDTGREQLSARRAALDRWVVRLADPVLTAVSRHWLFTVNVLAAAFVLGGLTAPLLLAAGLESAGQAVYQLYAGICHQWAFRSFFVLGPQAVLTRSQLEALGVDPYTFVGSAATGWKMAFCERDLAIFLGIFLFGLVYAARWRRAALPPSGYLVYLVLIAPMAVDGLTQLFGWRESTWELRLATGLLFGVASAWLLYPRFDLSARREAAL